MHMSVLQEAKVVLFCQSTSRAGAVNTNNGRKIRDHDKEAAIPNHFLLIIYLDETDYRLVLGLSPAASYRADRDCLKPQIIFSIPVDALHGIYSQESLGLTDIRGGKTLPPPSLLPATEIMGYVQHSSLCNPVQWRNWKKMNPEKMWIISSGLDKHVPVNAGHSTWEGGGAGACALCTRVLCNLWYKPIIPCRHMD